MTIGDTTLSTTKRAFVSSWNTVVEDGLGAAGCAELVRGELTDEAKTVVKATESSRGGVARLLGVVKTLLYHT